MRLNALPLECGYFRRQTSDRVQAPPLKGVRWRKCVDNGGLSSVLCRALADHRGE